MNKGRKMREHQHHHSSYPIGPSIYTRDRVEMLYVIHTGEWVRNTDVGVGL